MKKTAGIGAAMSALHQGGNGLGVLEDEGGGGQGGVTEVRLCIGGEGGVRGLWGWWCEATLDMSHNLFVCAAEGAEGQV